MELSEYLRILRKNWLPIVLLTALGLLGSIAFTISRTPIYESSSTIFVSTQAGSTAAELQQGSSFTQARINTYVGLVKTPIVLDPVISGLDLQRSAQTLSESVNASAAANSTLITITAADASSEQAALIANEVASSLSAAVPSLEPEAVMVPAPYV